MYEIGKSLNIRKVYEFAGIDRDTGVYRFTDFNGDGLVNAEDRIKTAEFGISYYGGVTNTFRYKNLSAQMLWQFVKQRQLDMVYDLAATGLMYNIPAYMLDYWTPDHPDASYQRPTAGDNYAALIAFDNYRNSDRAIVDASYIRLNSLQVNAAFNIGATGNSQLTLGFQGQNLLTFSPYKGLDPEVRGMYLPTLKTLSLTANLKF